MNNIKTSHIGIGLAVLILGGLGAGWLLQPEDSSVISRRGLHSHPTLTIYVKGEKLEIPANIGIGGVHQPMHTHVEDASRGVIHLEFSGVVREEDLMLGQFFKNWGKDMRGFGSNMRMTVNGNESTEFENYVMHDKDIIELRYE